MKAIESHVEKELKLIDFQIPRTWAWRSSYQGKGDCHK